MQQGLEQENVDLKLYLGNEAYFSENIVSLIDDGKIATLNNSDYVLFEFPLNVKPLNVYDVVYNMISRNYIPILAHPERYVFVQYEPNLLLELIQSGVLMQANYGSILGMYGEKAKITVEKFLENDMIHFLGSDVHRPNTIYTNIKDALDEIEFIVGEEKLNELTTINPSLVIENKEIEIDMPKKIVFSFKDKMKFKYKK